LIERLQYQEDLIGLDQNVIERNGRLAFVFERALSPEDAVVLQCNQRKYCILLGFCSAKLFAAYKDLIKRESIH
jgi:hypothetical protein